jgi:hypothetical protein
LSFETLSVVERNLILRELLKSHRARAFSPPEVDKLKLLRLFSARVLGGSGAAMSATGGSATATATATATASASASVTAGGVAAVAVAIADCSAGVFWCTDDGVLDGAVQPSGQEGRRYCERLIAV